MRLGCVACPEMDVNLTADEIRGTPAELSHVNDIRLTADGNFQLNQYRKVREGSSESVGIDLWNGNGYFPPDELTESILGKAPDSTQVCGHVFQSIGSC